MRASSTRRTSSAISESTLISPQPKCPSFVASLAALSLMASPVATTSSVTSVSNTQVWLLLSNYSEHSHPHPAFTANLVSHDQGSLECFHPPFPAVCPSFSSLAILVSFVLRFYLLDLVSLLRSPATKLVTGSHWRLVRHSYIFPKGMPCPFMAQGRGILPVMPLVSLWLF
jgi:hypothetical protein